ncbi:MAG: hypothetical protein R8K22_02965 [Mariprofundaceae bacterium]
MSILTVTTTHAESIPDEDMFEFLAEWDLNNTDWLEQNITEPNTMPSTHTEEKHD